MFSSFAKDFELKGGSLRIHGIDGEGKPRVAELGKLISVTPQRWRSQHGHWTFDFTNRTSQDPLQTDYTRGVLVEIGDGYAATMVTLATLTCRPL